MFKNVISPEKKVTEMTKVLASPKYFMPTQWNKNDEFHIVQHCFHDYPISKPKLYYVKHLLYFPGSLSYEEFENLMKEKGYRLISLVGDLWLASIRYWCICPEKMTFVGTSSCHDGHTSITAEEFFFEMRGEWKTKRFGL